MPRLLRRVTRLLTCAVLLAGCLSARGSGVTIVMHGLNSTIDDWVIAMAERIPEYPTFPGTNFSCYAIEVVANGSQLTTSARRIGGAAPSEGDTGEIFVKLDWSQLANNSYSTFQVAMAAAPRLLQTNFIPELSGHALAELPLHFIGHSRGGSLACELSRLLGTNGVWVDHLTSLDPHPLNNDGFDDRPLYTVVDAPARTYENVLFHDNYFQELDLFTHGEPVNGAYVRELTNLTGGYGGLFGSHSDVHLWYHGTIELGTPAGDTAATINSTERQSWWTAQEAAGVAAGFRYSRIAGGDRLSTNPPAGGTATIRDGYNQQYPLGAGVANNRTALTQNNGNWPNPITFRLTGTNRVLLGDTTQVTVRYQFARPQSETANVRFYLDVDRNVFNANQNLIEEVVVNGTGAANIGVLTLPLQVNGTAPGNYALLVEMNAFGNKRYHYTADTLSVVARPILSVQRQNDGLLTLRVTNNGNPAVVVESSVDLTTWQPFATNATGNGTITVSPVGDKRLFRAAVLP